MKKKQTKKSFKPHMMYDKDGKGYKANTYAQHLAMKKKGYTHSKKAGKPAPKKKAAKVARKKPRKKSGY